MKETEWNPFVPFYFLSSEGQILSLLRNRSCGSHPCPTRPQLSQPGALSAGPSSSRDITLLNQPGKTAAFASRSHADPDRPSVANGVRHGVDRSGSASQQCRAGCEGGEGFLR